MPRAAYVQKLGSRQGISGALKATLALSNNPMTAHFLFA